MTALPTGQTTVIELTAVERAVFEAIAYSDVFSFPLTAPEIWRLLPVAASYEAVASALAGAALGRLVTRVDPHPRPLSLPGRVGSEAESESDQQQQPYYVLAGREGLVGLRQRRTALSRPLRRAGERFGRAIGRLPFVRMVAITGSLAVDSADADADIDYLIVTRDGRVWLARALTMLVVRLAALRGVTLCPNYVLAESAVALPERSIYLARELVQMAPVTGYDVYRRMLAANGWYREYLPNAELATGNRQQATRVEKGTGNQEPGTRSEGSGLTIPFDVARRVAEAVLGSRLGDGVERWLLRRKGEELRRQAPGSRETLFDATMCKGHFEGHASRTEAAFAERLARLESATDGGAG